MSVVATVGPMTLSIGGQEIDQLDGIEVSDVIVDECFGEPGIVWSSNPGQLVFRDLNRLSIKLKRLDVIQPGPGLMTMDSDVYAGLRHATLKEGLRRTAKTRFASEPSYPRNRHERRRRAALERR